MTIETEAACVLISQSFIFKTDEEIDLESNFVEKVTWMDPEILLGENSVQDLDIAYEELTKLKYPPKRELRELKSWLQKNWPIEND